MPSSTMMNQLDDAEGKFEINKEELQAVVRNINRKEGKLKRSKQFKWALVAALATMAIVMACTFAVTFAAVETTKESHVGKNGELVSLTGEAVKVDNVKSFGNILGFPCLPRHVLETVDEVSLQVFVDKRFSSDGIVNVVMKVGTMNQFVTDKKVHLMSPSGKEELVVEHGRALYSDQHICAESCLVVVAIDVSTTNSSLPLQWRG